MKHNLSLPPPGAFEPEGKPSGDVKLGQKPVLPPPKKDLDEDEIRKAGQKAAANAVVSERPPAAASTAPIDMRVEREALAPPSEHKPLKPEKTRSSVVRMRKKKAAKAASMMDDEVAVVTRDPRKPHHE